MRAINDVVGSGRRSRVGPRLLRTCLVVVGAALVMATSAVAYSGSLVFALQQGDALYPQEQASLRPAQRLDALLLAGRQAGRPVKVAMFTADTDFGSRPELFGHPQQAAAALDSLLYPRPPVGRPPLIVVMPAGVAVRGASSADAALIRTIPVDIRADTDQIVAAAGLAVQAYERRHGVAVARTFSGAQATSTRSAPAARGAGVAVILSALGVVVGLLTRRRPTPDLAL